MTKVKKLLKKAFTLVELVVVVAIIAILSGVSVAAYVGITDRANKAADQDEVAQLNLQLAGQEAIEGKNKTCSDAVKDVIEAGLDIESMMPHTKNSQYVWDQEHDRFAILTDKNEVVAEDSTYSLTENKSKIWRMITTLPSTTDYSIYLRAGSTLTEIPNLNCGLDLGLNTSVKSITINSDSTKDINLYTNAMEVSLSIKGTANVNHYGYSNKVIVNLGGDNVFKEYGTVGRLELTKGHISVESGSTIYELEAETSNCYVSKSLTSTVYDYLGNINKREYDNDTTTFTTKALIHKSYDNCCYHEKYAQIIDKRHVTEVCLKCGCSLATVYADSWKISGNRGGAKYRRAYYDGTNYIYTPLVGFLSTQAFADEDSSFRPFCEEVLCSGRIKQSLYSTPIFGNSLMTYEEAKCNHYKMSDSHTDEVTLNQIAHETICKECGYKFMQFHNAHCSEHVWDDTTHTCTSNHLNSYVSRSGTGWNACLCGTEMRVWGSPTSYNDLYGDVISQSLISSVIVTDAETLDGELFSSSNALERISLSEGFKYIPKYFAFENSALSEIELPSTLESIGVAAFYCCPALKSLTLPEGFTTIESFAFSYVTYDMERIEVLNLPSTITTIRYDSFLYCGDSLTINFNGTQAQWNAACKISDPTNQDVIDMREYNYPGVYDSFSGIAGGFKVNFSDGTSIQY